MHSAQTITDVFLAADAALLQPQGFMGMGARGVGGPKCGSTGLVCLLYQTPGGAPGALTLLSANVGDARAVLVRGGVAQQLSYDHVPDDENERRRIERNKCVCCCCTLLACAERTNSDAFLSFYNPHPQPEPEAAAGALRGQHVARGRPACPVPRLRRRLHEERRRL